MGSSAPPPPPPSAATLAMEGPAEGGEPPSAPTPDYPRGPRRSAAQEQPPAVERPNAAPRRRWACKAIVFQQGTGKAAAKIYETFQDFEGA